MALFYFKKAKNILGNLKTENDMAKENNFGKIIRYMKDIGAMIRLMVKVE